MQNEILVDNIKNWLQIDDDIRELQAKIKEKRKQKKTFTNNLVQIMKNNSIDAFDINDGKLLFTRNKTKTPLSKKHLITSVSKFFPNDKKVVDDLCNFIMSTRTAKTTENIKRKMK